MGNLWIRIYCNAAIEGIYKLVIKEGADQVPSIDLGNSRFLKAIIYYGSMFFVN